MMETTPLNIPPKSNEDAHIQTLRVLFCNVLISATLLTASASHIAPDVGRAKVLLSQNVCLGCHAVESHVVGPAYKGVAAKYKNGNPVVLGVRIKSGRAGKWGEIAMSPQTQLPDVDARILAAWILVDHPDQ